MIPVTLIPPVLIVVYPTSLILPSAFTSSNVAIPDEALILFTIILGAPERFVAFPVKFPVKFPTKDEAVTTPTFRFGVPARPNEVVANDAVDAVPVVPVMLPLNVVAVTTPVTFIPDELIVTAVPTTADPVVTTPALLI